MTARFDYRSVVLRMLVSGFVVCAAYNPSGYSYAHWVTEWTLEMWEFKLLAGIILFGALAFFVQTTYNILKVSGALYVILACISVTLVLAQAGLLDLSQWQTVMNVALATVVMLLTVGLSLSHIQHRLTGIQHVEGSVY